MSRTEQTADEPKVETMTDAEWAAAQREAMGEDYPGDAEMQRQREDFQRDFEAHNAAQDQAGAADAPAPAPAPEPAQAKEWNARDWLNEAFKDDPTFKDLSPEDMARLEALANEKHEEFTGKVKEWAEEQGAEWNQELRAGIDEGMATNPKLQEFMETRLADGDLSAEDKAALEAIGRDLTPQEAAGAIKPIVEAVHEVHVEFIDGVEMIVDHAIEDTHDIVEARAEMPGGDSPQVQTMLTELEAAPAKLDDVFEFDRHDADREWGKVEDRLELIEAGADPKDLPPDADTYQVDDNQDQYETADA